MLEDDENLRQRSARSAYSVLGYRPLIVVGDHEILLDDSTHFAEKARSAGVDTTLHVWEGMVHCFPLLAPMFTEATQAWEEIIAYIKKRLNP